MKPPRSKIWRIGAIIVLTLGVVFVSYLLKPLPPPKVMLQLVGIATNKTKAFYLESWTNNGQIVLSGNGLFVTPAFEGFSTNQEFALCTIGLTNQGSTRIWWTGGWGCRVEARTPGGWVTNGHERLTLADYPVAPSSNDNFIVYVPVDAIEWRARCWYTYYNRHHVRYELAAWLMNDVSVGHTILRYTPEVVWWPLQQLPEPRENYGQVSTPFFTNRLPLEINRPKPHTAPPFQLDKL